MPNPQLMPKPTRRILVAGVALIAGLGNGTDFSNDPNYQKAWGQVQNQLQSEGQDITLGKAAFDQAINDLVAQTRTLDPSLYEAAARYTIASHTITGAIQSIQGLVQAFDNPNIDPGVAMSAFAGVMVGAATAAGILTAGLAAAIMGVVAVAGQLVSQFFGVKPVPQSDFCGQSVDSSIFSGQNPVRIFGCLITPTNIVTDPASPLWNTYPDPNGVPNQPGFEFGDADWYNGVNAYKTKDAAHYGGYGNATVFYWSGNSKNARASWGGGSPVGMMGPYAVPDDGNVPIQKLTEGSQAYIDQVAQFASIPLIDPDAGQFSAFLKAYVAAWKKNFEYVLNGLNPPVAIADEWKLFLQTLKTWNVAHSPGQTRTINAYGGNDPSWPPGLVSMVMGIVAHSSPDAPNNQVVVNTGPERLKLSPGTIRIITGTPGGAAATSGMSTGAKVATGIGIAVGLGLAGAGIYAYRTHTPYLTVLNRGWQKTGGRVVGAVRRKL